MTDHGHDGFKHQLTPGRIITCLTILAVFFLAWEILRLPPRGQETVSVSFVGFTNDVTGCKAAQFELTSRFGRDIGLLAGPVEIYGPMGWPVATNLAYAGQILLMYDGPEYKVKPGGKQSFQVRLPNIDGVKWRAPVLYGPVSSTVDRWRDELRRLFGLPVVGLPSIIYTPEQVGIR